jgi:hypothetical protein
MSLNNIEEKKKIRRNTDLQKKEIKRFAISTDNSYMICLYEDGSLESFDLNKKENKSSSIYSFVMSSISSSYYSSNMYEKIDPIPCDIVFTNDWQCLCKN